VSKLHFKIAGVVALIVSAAGWFWLLTVLTKWLFGHLR
jgi:hypothetical protein